jgi:hypothetical protein
MPVWSSSGLKSFLYSLFFPQIELQFLILAFSMLMILLEVCQAGVPEQGAIPNEAPQRLQKCSYVIINYCYPTYASQTN